MDQSESTAANLDRRSRRCFQFSLRTAFVGLTVFAIWLLSKVDLQPTQHGIAFRRGKSAVSTFAKRKLLASVKQIDRLTDALRHYTRDGSCIDAKYTKGSVTIISGEPASSWFHIWEPLQGTTRENQEEQALLESLGPSLDDDDE